MDALDEIEQMNLEVGMIIQEEYKDSNDSHRLPRANRELKSQHGDMQPHRSKNLRIETDDEQVGGAIVSVEKRHKNN